MTAVIMQSLFAIIGVIWKSPQCFERTSHVPWILTRAKGSNCRTPIGKCLKLDIIHDALMTFLIQGSAYDTHCCNVEKLNEPPKGSSLRTPIGYAPPGQCVCTLNCCKVQVKTTNQAMDSNFSELQLRNVSDLYIISWSTDDFRPSRTVRMNTHCYKVEKPTKSKGFEHIELQSGNVPKLDIIQWIITSLRSSKTVRMNTHCCM